MKKAYYIILFLLCSFCAACIKNDIPYPYIVGKITSISLVGQKGEAEILPDKNTINLSVDETVNMREVTVAGMVVNEEARIVASSDNFLDKNMFPAESFEDYGDVPSRNTKINFSSSKSAEFSIETYQKYTWTINVTQDIERYVNVEGQVGDAIIDVVNRSVLLRIEKSKDMGNVTVTSMKLGVTGSAITPDFITVTNFNRPNVFTVTSPFGDVEEWKIDIQYSESSVVTTSVDPWAKFAYFYGGLVEGQTGAGFEYKKSADADWTTVEAGGITIEKTTFSAKVTGLSPETDYVFRAVNGDEKAESIAFTTEAATVLPNGSMETWSMGTGSAAAEKTAYPSSDGANSYWATGNEGVTMAFAGGKPSNTAGTNDSKSGKAARMESITVNALGFAAGSLVTGEYKTQVSLDPTVASTSMKPGREFIARPLKLRGWYKYSPKTITVVHKNYASTPGVGDQLNKMDKCHIYIRLEDRTNGAKDEIAYGELKTDAESTGYQPFEIVLDYKLKNRRPTHISIVCSSSYLGDFFTGGIGSTLYLDELELVYDQE